VPPEIHGREPFFMRFEEWFETAPPGGQQA